MVGNPPRESTPDESDAYVSSAGAQGRAAIPAASAGPRADARATAAPAASELRWTPLQAVAPQGRDGGGPSRASYMASPFSAGLELVKEGALEARQLAAFDEIYLRMRRGEAA